MLFASNGPMAVNPALYSALAYDPVKDFIPVAYVGRVPMAVVTNAASPAKSMRDLIKADKAKPGSVNVALQSTTPRMVLNEFNQAAGTKLTAVFFRSGRPAESGVEEGLG